MLDQKFFEKLEKNHQNYRSKRHELIKTSSDILKKSKQVIFAVHRDNQEEAKKMLEETENTISTLIQTEFTKEPRLRHEGAFRAALEEFIEARLFFDYINTQNLQNIEVIEPEFDEWIGGICDFTGEVVRKSVLSVTEGKTDIIKDHAKTVSDIIENLIKLDISGKIRVKFDDAKRNLKRLEEILYDLEIHK